MGCHAGRQHVSKRGSAMHPARGSIARNQVLAGARWGCGPCETKAGHLLRRMGKAGGGGEASRRRCRGGGGGGEGVGWWEGGAAAAGRAKSFW